MVKVAINGFGRIGRLALRKLMEQTGEFEVVAINDLTDAKMLAHLFKYDSAQGRFNGEIEVEEGAFVVNGHKIKVTAERNPADLPWGGTILMNLHGMLPTFTIRSFLIGRHIPDSIFMKGPSLTSATDSEHLPNLSALICTLLAIYSLFLLIINNTDP